MSYSFETIFTLNARGHIFLEVTTEHFNLSDPNVFQLIQQLFRETKDVLARKKIDYSTLRGALVPRVDRREHALAFDYTKFGTPVYGPDVFDRLLPLLSKDSSHSILCGDWLHDGDFSEWLSISPVAQGTIDPEKTAALRHQTIYFVYLNNLTDAAAARIHQGFVSHPAYLGMLDMTRATPLKAYLSTCLVCDCIKHRTLVIRGHEDDRDPSEDHNLSLVDFSRSGLVVRSLPSLHYGVFLSYKIERPSLPRELDQRFALNAVTPKPAPIDDFQIVVEEPKLEYLRTNKQASLKRAGFDTLTAEQLGERIREKISATYIYELAHATNAATLKFNVMIEADTGARAMCSLEYLPKDQKLRVITFF